jgi:hypothetical protein
MKVNLRSSWQLTDEHAASSYGQPVLVNRASGETFGPADILQPHPSWPSLPASGIVERMAKTAKLTDEERAFVARFVNFGK